MQDYDGVIVKEHCQTIISDYIELLYVFRAAVEHLLQDSDGMDEFHF